MLEMQYKNSSEKYLVEVRGCGHVIQLMGNFPAQTSGFLLSRQGMHDNWDYSDYTTIYRIIPGGVQFSDDGSVYVAPVQPVPTVTFLTGEGGSLEGEVRQSTGDYADLEIPTPVPGENYVFSEWAPEIPASGKIDGNKSYRAVFLYVPTLEEMQENKIAEINAMQQAVIAAGVNVTLTDGTVEHFTLTDHDQTSLMGLQSQVMAGEQMIPWHTSDEAEHCKFYSNADMALITAAALAYVTWHVTYFRDLRIYIRSLADKEAVAAVTYGMDIPEAYQSAPLQAMIAAQNA